jgi:hypothetical protein
MVVRRNLALCKRYRTRANGGAKVIAIFAIVKRSGGNKR